jgi:hypothetical protein
MTSIASGYRRIGILERVSKSFAKLFPVIESRIRNKEILMHHDQTYIKIDWTESTVPIAFCHQDVYDGIVSDRTFCQ